MIPIFVKQYNSLHKLKSIDLNELFRYNGNSPEDGKTFVHCLQGKDRTGLMVALYRIQNKWPAEKAREEAIKLDFGKNLPTEVTRAYMKVMDDNSAFDIPMQSDYIADSKFNNNFQNSFAPYDSDVTPQEQYGIVNQWSTNLDFWDNREIPTDPRFVGESVPRVGEFDNYTAMNCFGPVGVGGGFV